MLQKLQDRFAGALVGEKIFGESENPVATALRV
jgi:hypothetical protein